MQFYHDDWSLNHGVQSIENLLDTIRATIWEVTQNQLLAASTILGPSPPVVQTVPQHPERAAKARVVRTASEYVSGSLNEHVGRASRFGMKRAKEGYVGPSWCTAE